MWCNFWRPFLCLYRGWVGLRSQVKPRAETRLSQTVVEVKENGVCIGKQTHTGSLFLPPLGLGLKSSHSLIWFTSLYKNLFPFQTPWMFLCSDEECMSLILRHIPSLQYFKLHSEGLENFLLWHRRVQADQLPCASFLWTPWPWGNTAHLFIWVKHYSIQCLAAFCSPQQLWYQDTVDRSVWSPPLGRITSAQFSVPQLG